MHPKLDEINRLLADGVAGGVSNRAIARQFGVGRDALQNHASSHLTAGFKQTVAKHAELVKQTRDMDVLACLNRCATKAERMLDSADDWLRDPNDPRKYNLNPRTHEVEVVYEEMDGEKLVKKTAALSSLLKRLEDGMPITVIRGEVRTADPRKLLLDAVGSLKPVLEVLGKALGQIKPDPGMTLNVFLAGQEWQAIKTSLKEALRPFPPALTAASEALKKLGGEP
jgi:hypothetical protein